ncbi:hypothetical protein LCGC14_0231620 [marine sediment metagenome]|uniref:Uncharacterized protein n=1 Tax=marine sediment metagenome TaxID=412755 RepID=A0A0F9UEG0_9ZZZZ
MITSQAPKKKSLRYDYQYIDHRDRGIYEILDHKRGLDGKIAETFSRDCAEKIVKALNLADRMD